MLPPCILAWKTFERGGVTDLIYRIVQVLREDLERLAVSARDAGLMEPVKPWDEG